MGVDTTYFEFSRRPILKIIKIMGFYKRNFILHHLIPGSLALLLFKEKHCGYVMSMAFASSLTVCINLNVIHTLCLKWVKTLSLIVDFGFTCLQGMSMMFVLYVWMIMKRETNCVCFHVAMVTVIFLLLFNSNSFFVYVELYWHKGNMRLEKTWILPLIYQKNP